MNRNEFNRFVAGIDLPGPGDLEGLRELTVLFPWFHSAHLLLLKGLRENSDIRFDSQLKASALSVNDREVLYHYLFLPPDEVSPEAENFVKEEVVAPEETSPVEEMIAPVEEVTAPVEEELTEVEVPAPVEEVAAPVEEELTEVEVPAPVEEVAAPVEEVIATVEEEVVQATEDIAPVEEVAAPEEEMIAPVTDVASDESEISEVQGILASDEAAVTDEGQAEDSPGEETDVPEADPNARLRTREELITEIEERLKELESYRQVTFKEQKAEVIIETVVSPGPVPEEVSMPVAEAEPAPEEASEPAAAAEPAPEEASEAVAATEPSSVHVPEYMPEPEPEIEEPSAPEPEIEEPSAPEPEIEEPSAPEPEIEEPSAPEPEIEEPSAPEPEIEEPSAPEPEIVAAPDLEPESTELLELLPETVTEEQQPQPERKLSPADLIDRFIMISPNIERMSPKDYHPVRDLSEQDSGEPGKFITETLAKIYINQGYYTRAINIYEKLTLQYPEKSAYFASRIEKIKDLIK